MTADQHRHQAQQYQSNDYDQLVFVIGGIPRGHVCIVDFLRILTEFLAVGRFLVVIHGNCQCVGCILRLVLELGNLQLDCELGNLQLDWELCNWQLVGFPGNSRWLDCVGNAQ